MSDRYIDYNTNEEVFTTHEWGFYRPEEEGFGFCFVVDKDGNLLSEHNRKNFELCKAGKMPRVRDCGIKKIVSRIKLCSCGSLLHYEDVYDARGLFVGRVCDKCRAKRLGGYRQEIFTNGNYDTCESVEEDY